MTNFEKIKESITLEDFAQTMHTDKSDIFCRKVPTCKGSGRVIIQGNKKYCSCYSSCSECYKWLQQEYKPSIIDDGEREYLAAVIEPFKDKVNYIEKSNGKDKDTEHIFICYCSNKSKYEYLVLPDFDKDMMYKGMKLLKEYKLEDLGL